MAGGQGGQKGEGAWRREHREEEGQFEASQDLTEVILGYEDLNGFVS